MISNKRMAIYRLTTIALLVGFILTDNHASAQNTSWTNPILGNWFVGGNWSIGEPYAYTFFGSRDAVIENGGLALIGSPGAASGDLTVGGTLQGGGVSISGGGTLLQSGRATVATVANRTATVTVNGSGSRWDVAEAISAGGNGTIRIENGGDVTSAHPGFLDFYPAGAPGGTVVVTGVGSTWNMNETFTVGFTRPASLTVSGGGVLTSNSGIVGFASGANATATITGTGSTWNNGGILEVGRDAGAGVLRIGDRALVQATALRISNTGSVEVNNGQSNVAGLVVSGVASTLSSTSLGGLTVANSSSGRMVVQNGGQVANSFALIGAVSGTVGTVLVQGAGSTWTNTDQVVAGLSGFGTLEVRSGGTLNSVRGFAGANTNSSGTIIVSDPGSTWNASGSFFIGNSGNGLLQVLNGAVATTAGNSHLGFTAGATGDVVVSGAGSTLNVGVLLNIGGDSAVARGAGSVGIADGGTLNVGSATNLYSTGRLDLLNEVTLTGEINAFGGLISTRGNTTLTSAIHLQAGGVSVEPNLADGVATFSGVIDGAGGLTKSTLIGITGNGTLVLTAANTYTGPTTLNRGTLLVDGSIISTTTVNAGATLGGSGTIDANVNINGGIVAPGNSPGTLHVTGNYTQNAASTLKIQIASPTDFDRLAVTGAMTLGGTLEISFIDGFTPTADQTFDILSFGGLSGAFSSISLPSVEGLTWDASQLASGVIGVDVIEPPLAAADFDENGLVDGDDLIRWQTNFSTGTTHSEGDADLDADADGDDFLAWQRQAGSGLASATASRGVPAPGAPGNFPVSEPTASLLSFGAVACLAGARKLSA